MTPRSLTRALAVAAAGTMLLAAAATSAAGAAAPARTPQPVFVADKGEAADPGVVRDGNDYYAFLTGGPLARVISANTPQGPWSEGANALSRWPAWASGKGAVWAPDVARTSAGWVLYYSAQAKGFKGQRCIGTAISTSPAGPYEPSDSPLICPILGGEDVVADRPDQTAGVIDPSPFQAADGQRYLLYKTQKTPGTIRMFPVSSDGLHGRGAVSHELFRHADSIENPTMVQRGDSFIVFASANWYDQCKYETVWRRSDDMWSFADKEEHVLLDKASTNLCGPGGADIVTNGNGPSRIFFHAWVCGEQGTPCDFDGVVTDKSKRRVIYAGVLTWGDDGATPQVPAILSPVGAPSR